MNSIYFLNVVCPLLIYLSIYLEALLLNNFVLNCVKCVTLIYFCQVYLVSICLLLFAIFETFLKLSCSYLDFLSLVTWRSRRVTDVAI